MNQAVVKAVRSLASEIIDHKIAEHLGPAVATATEIQQDFNSMLIDAMRQLCRDGVFRGSKNVNGIPMLSID